MHLLHKICDTGQIQPIHTNNSVSRSRRVDTTPVALDIHQLSHDGRGVARRTSPEGKVVFVDYALPGEKVLAVQTRKHTHFDEAYCVEVLSPSPHRVAPRCPHFGVCSGCVLQHLDIDQQILAKQTTLLENLARIGRVHPQSVIAPLTGTSWGYRRKGRFSVRHVAKKEKTLIGFRERNPRFVADLTTCHTIVPEIAQALPDLRELIEQLDVRQAVAQIEFSSTDTCTAITIRHLAPLSSKDRALMIAFASRHNWAIFLQPEGPDSIRVLWPERAQLSYYLHHWDIRFDFNPLDFIQVNASINEKMLLKVMETLNLSPNDHVLDLFCGLGNFTLPMARYAAHVIGVEGDAGLIARARGNALVNKIDNVTFYSADLTQNQSAAVWLDTKCTILLLDPPRSGAIDILKQLPLKRFQRIMYVSCHPASLARDADYLVHYAGFTVKIAGVMDMFPHTAHVESMVLFESN